MTSQQSAMRCSGWILIGAGALEGVLKSIMGSKEAAQVTAELRDWMDEDDRRRFRGFERADYSSDGLPQRPRNAPLRSIDELLELPSVTPSLPPSATRAA